MEKVTSVPEFASSYSTIALYPSSGLELIVHAMQHIECPIKSSGTIRQSRDKINDSCVPLLFFFREVICDIFVFQTCFSSFSVFEINATLLG